MNTSANLRKAAVLLRSLDSDTATLMLGQLSTAEAAAIRAALRDLGPLDQEEQADVAAEFRRVRPMVGENAASAVELSLSSSATGETAEANGLKEPPRPTQRFDFLVGASTTAVVAMLIREHAQTVAVVLAHLAPERAAAILAALPERLQADTMERLSVLGETDAESVTVIERELAVWLATRTEDRGAMARRRESVTKILAATDPKTRRSIVSNLRMRGTAIAAEIAPLELIGEKLQTNPQNPLLRLHSTQPANVRSVSKNQLISDRAPARPLPPPSMRPTPHLRVEFDQLVHFDTAALSAVLREVDANVLALALAGSHDELVDRIASQMPKRTARVFRRELRKLGPTKLSDVEGAQRIVAESATRYLVQRRRPRETVARS
jgi:flagellar motor switch protein FliG